MPNLFWKGLLLTVHACLIASAWSAGAQESPTRHIFPEDKDRIDPEQVVFSCALHETLAGNTAKLGEGRDGEVEANILKVIRKIGVRPNFLIFPSEDAGYMAASIEAGEINSVPVVVRTILYAPSGIREMRAKSSTEWPIFAGFAHEIGHHFQGHTLNDPEARKALGGEPWDIELEADEYAGFVLAQFGATPEEATEVWRQVLVSEQGSDSHPPSHLRIEAILRGYKAALDQQQSAGARPASRDRIDVDLSGEWRSTGSSSRAYVIEDAGSEVFVDAIDDSGIYLGYAGTVAGNRLDATVTIEKTLPGALSTVRTKHIITATVFGDGDRIRGTRQSFLDTQLLGSEPLTLERVRASAD